jgi:hypothetical protein
MNGNSARSAAAAFLGEALSLAGAHEEIEAGLETIHAGEQEAVFAAELETSGGPVAFLIYAFRSSGDGPDRQSEAVETMLRAAEFETPGPRLVAEAEAAGWGMLLATTPAGLAILAGEEADPHALEPERGPRLDAAARAQAADALLDALRTANERAAELGRMLPPPGAEDWTTEERALMLFLLDPGSLGELTRVMRWLADEAGRAGAGGR